MNSVAVIVHLHIKAGHESDFIELLHPVLDAMRHEPTFINAVLHQDPVEANRFMIYETWADMADLKEVQVKREYRKEYEERLEALSETPRRIEVWEPMRSDFAFPGRT